MLLLSLVPPVRNWCTLLQRELLFHWQTKLGGIFHRLDLVALKLLRNPLRTRLYATQSLRLFYITFFLFTFYFTNNSRIENYK